VELSLWAGRPVRARIHVTSRRLVEAAFDGAAEDDPLPRSARYRLSLYHECDGTGPSYAGLELEGKRVPHAGLDNGTLEAETDGDYREEPYGEITSHTDDKRYVEGRVSAFGGPDDTSFEADRQTQITRERLSELNDPLDPTPGDLLARAPDYYYAAMRVDYRPDGSDWWAHNGKLVVVNPRTNRRVVVRIVDWGPHPRTERILNLSPQAMRDLDLHTNDRALVAFAAPSAELGPVR
jgi:hypothetical protein